MSISRALPFFVRTNVIRPLIKSTSSHRKLSASESRISVFSSKENIARYFMVAESPREREENFRGLFLAASSNPPCEEVSDEPSFEDRHDRCYVLADALRQELAAQHGFDPPCLYSLIDPFGMWCEDTVYVAYLYTPDPLDLGQAVLLYAVSVPAGLRFDQLSQFEAYLWEQYTHLERGYARVVRRRVPAIPSTP